ncbi:hypothetical protein SAMN03159382_03190 [Pseudomonas sp. NFACC23-1]|uniref:hypothetical protein n=1 Tax=unclassified Pseudomonas TaxID=196821 RepID=UPI00088BBD2E|nr:MULTISPECIES: hypothetical protein [unclassified Pseudomonas]SDB39043.1 hypothetical protein SAMN03159386_02852 [Pseudomonas sp. NFACC17-2]SEJ57399.1 hypothetical protein SAMN03159382_03190 [Pseudomonas sp. NFACC23-1]SFW72880.1 hypothetical protein SAMN05660640_03056 [Pseudomonas sp. NFACC16-2]
MPTIDDFLPKLTAASGTASLAATLPQQFSVSACGPYPLASHVDIPSNSNGGELLLALNDISVSPVKLLSVVPDRDASRIVVNLAPMQLSGTYDLFGLESAKVQLDTGGLMAPLASFAVGASTVDDADPPTITEKQYDQLQQANDQRTQLNQTANGRSLLDTFNQHNDAYTDVFNNNSQLRTSWAKGGAIAEMFDYTSQALATSGMPVNPQDKLFGTQQLSYNMHAFSQKIHLYYACLKPYPDAAVAALSFQAQVATNTQNTQQTVVPMTADSVYNTVNTAPPANQAALQLQIQSLQETFARIADNTHDDTDLDLCVQHGFVMDPDTIVRVQAIYAESLRLHDPKRRLPLHSGPFSSSLAESHFVFALSEQPDGALTLKLQRSSLSVPVLDLETAQWQGQAGEIGRSRLGSANFIRGILEDRIASQLTRVLRTLASQEA